MTPVVSKLSLEYKVPKMQINFHFKTTYHLPSPHLIRYVMFVLQLQHSPGCEAFNHTLCLCSRQLLQDGHARLRLQAAQNAFYQYIMDA